MQVSGSSPNGNNIFPEMLEKSITLSEKTKVVGEINFALWRHIRIITEFIVGHDWKFPAFQLLHLHSTRQNGKNVYF